MKNPSYILSVQRFDVRAFFTAARTRKNDGLGGLLVSIGALPPTTKKFFNFHSISPRYENSESPTYTFYLFFVFPPLPFSPHLCSMVSSVGSAIYFNTSPEPLCVLLIRRFL